MIHIDGSQKSGSGTIVRNAASLAILCSKPVSVSNIRAKRTKPGLRPQHLKALQSAAQVCGGRLEGASIGARNIVFTPGKRIKGGAFDWEWRIRPATDAHNLPGSFGAAPPRGPSIS
jgi:RNA 3'-terminal phosphate cyclase (ATP)